MPARANLPVESFSAYRTADPKKSGLEFNGLEFNGFCGKRCSSSCELTIRASFGASS